MSKPKPGEFLIDPDDNAVYVVIERGWSDERIRQAFADRYVEDGGYTIDKFYMYSARQRRDEQPDFPSFWGPDGECKTYIDVAVIEL